MSTKGGVREEEAEAADASLTVLALGGGTQSCALALMSARGDIDRLDHVVFADTKGELPETYEYIEWLGGQLEAARIPLHRVTAGSLEELLLGDRLSGPNPTPPAHVLNPNGTKGRVGGYRCSYDFKRRIIERKIKQLCGGRGAWKRATVEQWIGFSSDEHKRMKQTDACRCGHNRLVRRAGELVQVHTAVGCTRCGCVSFDPWMTNRWPLIEMRMHREDTIRWFSAHGYPTPPRSACWFCPNSHNERWQALQVQHPDLFERACVIDEAIRVDGSGFRAAPKSRLDGELFLHASLQPLREADLRTARQRERDAGVLTLFDDYALEADCESGVCFT